MRVLSPGRLAYGRQPWSRSGFHQWDAQPLERSCVAVEEGVEGPFRGLRSFPKVFCPPLVQRRCILDLESPAALDVELPLQVRS